MPTHRPSTFTDLRSLGPSRRAPVVLAIALAHGDLASAASLRATPAASGATTTSGRASATPPPGDPPKAAASQPDPPGGAADQGAHRANEGDDDLVRAMQAFERGAQHYNRAQYEAALADFLEAATLYASPDFQYNIGLCYERLDKPEEAIAAFRTYLKTKQNPPDRANVEDRIARLEAQLKEADPPAPTDTTDRAAPTPVRAPAARPEGLIYSGAALTAVGAAVALAGGLGFGVVAKRRSDQLDRVQTGGNPDNLGTAAARDLEREGKRFEVGQVVSIAAGAAVGVVGVALLTVGVRRRQAGAEQTRAQVRTGLGPSAFGLEVLGRF